MNQLKKPEGFDNNWRAQEMLNGIPVQDLDLSRSDLGIAFNKLKNYVISVSDNYDLSKDEKAYILSVVDQNLDEDIKMLDNLIAKMAKYRRELWS